ncbi:MAG: hypothetical protein LBO65_09055 [Spirochaetaceae bacterium]|jgi:hypothetical protein|nr:hypothetical protein [Spirochaetaceae bacterium]
MRTNRSTRSRASRAADIAVVCACLLGTAAFLFLFQRDLNRSLRRLDQEPAGFVSFRSGAALRRFQDRNIWDRLQQEAPVYNGDLIRTAGRSEVAIGFSGGALVDVSENSLIRVLVEEGAPRIDFSGGTIRVRAGESGGVTISFGENRVRAGAGSTINLEAGADTGGNANAGETYTFQVIEGSASLTGPGGEREAAAGAALTFNGTGLVEESRIAAAGPPVQTAVETPPVEAAEPVEAPIAAVPVEPPQLPPSVRQPAAPVEPPVRRPSPLPAPSGRKPENGYRLDPETLRESRTIVFRWNPVEGADGYVFTLFHETGPRRRQPVLTVEGPETSYTLEDLSILDLGRFVWQVEAVNRRGGGRRGSPGENLFTVDIPQPEIPRGRNPGDLYAR